MPNTSVPPRTGWSCAMADIAETVRNVMASRSDENRIVKPS
jgi:hypothetical protein